MSKIIENLKQWRTRDSDKLEEEFKISSGCCLFHDKGELNKFTNIDDDIYNEF